MPALAAGESAITWPTTASMSASEILWYFTMYSPVRTADRQHHVHERSGKGDDQPLPSRLGQEAARIVGTLFVVAGCSPAILT